MTDEGSRKGLGDDQGTHVGAPTPASGKTGMGSEATEGVHGADSNRSEGDRSALEGKERGRGTKKDGDRSGSEPIESHDTEHRSKYGGGSRREDGEGQRE